MKKAELMEIASRYEMDFIRNNITNEGVGVWKRSAELIPELDAIVEANQLPVTGERLADPEGYTYRIFCPSNWIDLWGWKD